MRCPAKDPRQRVSSFVFFLGALATLVVLLYWARQRAAVLRVQSAEREQRALERELTSRIGGAAATGAARSAPSATAARPVPNEALSHAPEQAAAGLDPIEELISQIVADPDTTPKKAPLATRVKRRLLPLSMRYPMEADSIGTGVPLRELVLAWYESRGYRGTPASLAVWPIELVLRHCDDAARAYAFVVQHDHVSLERMTALVEQSREIGLLRVAIVAESGYEKEAKAIARKRHVRLIDRRTMEAELLALELPTAAKIIAVARKRAAEAVPAAA
jgi:hypothetical protein